MHADIYTDTRTHSQIERMGGGGGGEESAGASEEPAERAVAAAQRKARFVEIGENDGNI